MPLGNRGLLMLTTTGRGWLSTCWRGVFLAKKTLGGFGCRGALALLFLSYSKII